MQREIRGSKERIRQLSWSLSALALVGLFACGCGDPDTPSTASLLRRGLFSEPATLDPHLSRQNEMTSLLNDLFEGLVSVGPDGGLDPGVAESWAVSEDGLHYSFELRGDARWSDGSAVVAADFVASFRRVVDPATASPHPGMLTMIVGAEDIVAGRAQPESLGVRAAGPRRLEIDLAYPAPYFLSVLTHSSAMPVHAESVTTHGREFTRPGRLISNGAYTLAAREEYQYLELVKNPHYWNAGDVDIERVRYVTYDGDGVAQWSAYRAGQLDMTDFVPNSAVDEVASAYHDEFVVRPTNDTFYYAFNLRAGPLVNAPTLRAELSRQLSRETIVERVTRFGERPAYSFVPPVFGDYHPAQLPFASATGEPASSERAEPAALDAPPRLRVLYNTNEGLRRITVAVTSMWRESLGVESVLENQEFGVFLQSLGDPTRWDVARLSWRADFDDPFAFLEIFMSESPNNFVGFADPEYDALIARSHRAGDRRERMALLRQAEQRLLDAHAIAPVFFYVERILVKPWVVLGQRSKLDPLRTRDLSLDPDRA